MYASLEAADVVVTWFCYDCMHWTLQSMARVLPVFVFNLATLHTTTRRCSSNSTVDVPGVCSDA